MALSPFTTLTPAVGSNNWKSLAHHSPGLWGHQEAPRLAATISFRPPLPQGILIVGFFRVELGSPQSIPQASLPPGCASTSSSVKWETNESSGSGSLCNLQSTLAKDPLLPSWLRPRSGSQWAWALENRLERPELLKRGICPLPEQPQAATPNASLPLFPLCNSESDLLNAWKYAHPTAV